MQRAAVWPRRRRAARPAARAACRPRPPPRPPGAAPVNQWLLCTIDQCAKMCNSHLLRIDQGRSSCSARSAQNSRKQQMRARAHKPPRAARTPEEVQAEGTTACSGYKEQCEEQEGGSAANCCIWHCKIGQVAQDQHAPERICSAEVQDWTGADSR